MSVCFPLVERTMISIERQYFYTDVQRKQNRIKKSVYSIFKCLDISENPDPSGESFVKDLKFLLLLIGFSECYQCHTLITTVLTFGPGD